MDISCKFAPTPTLLAYELPCCKKAPQTYLLIYPQLISLCSVIMFKFDCIEYGIKHDLPGEVT